MLLLLVLACGSAPTPEPPSPEPAVVRDADLDPRDHAIPRSYDEPLDIAYPAPDGFTRVDADPLATWLRALGVGPIHQALLTWRGDPVHHAGRLIRMGLTGHGQRGLASAVRVRAEYLRASGSPVVFRGAEGEVVFGPEEDWEAWLTELFTQVDADTLRADTVPASTPHPGDVLVQPDGAHAATVLDVATRGDEVVVLIGEGHVPAQYFHVEHGPYIYWWPWHPEAGVEGFHVPLPASALRRWSEP